MEVDEYRPATLLTDWLSKYGYGKNRSTGENAVQMCYAHLSEWDGSDWVSRWSMTGADGDPEITIHQSFMELCEMLKKSEGQGSRAMRVNALLMVTHGHGTFGAEHPDTGELMTWDNFSDDMKQKASDAEPVIARQAGRPIPCRMVNIITPSGLGADVSIFFDGQDEPEVQTVEQWTGDGVEPEAMGKVDEVLSQLFAFLYFLREVVVSGEPLNVDGLMTTAMNNLDNPMGKQMMALILRGIADGFANGFGDDDDDE
ncbi:hypothetical protein UFOVP1083_5 [uncultured Caudovirales phage]|uniref:Uncharacterized protein n=1 Tax=uncultured Caudovirales phage TaxID=2100421 RepID=A0A6J5QDN9_9CAUD|nr:hypothetical protein UFOVP1083_5 [uncultured Caudovirales phage]CAB4199508.1 hypothetical protein UFOVP1327_48 [uncultured Caudovirales phage]